MERIFMFLALLMLAQGALAEEKSVAQKAGDGVEKAVEATERGLKKGGEAAGRGIEQGAKHTVKGVKKAEGWVGKKMEKGGETLEKASK